jgi:hypothetical protein
VRQLVGDDGQAIADYMFAVLTSEAEKTSDRMAAATWLADRGFGRANHAAIDEAPRWPDLDEMELEDLTAIRDILAKYA